MWKDNFLYWLTTCLPCAEARARPSSVQLKVAFISSTSSFSIFSFWISCWFLRKREQRQSMSVYSVSSTVCTEACSSYIRAWFRSSSFSSASFWLVSSILSTTCFSFFTSSWSFWLFIWRSVTQYTSSDVSLGKHARIQRQNTTWLYRMKAVCGWWKKNIKITVRLYKCEDSLSS